MAAAPVLVFDTLDSTNAEARRRASDGERGPLWIRAARQTAGRGRQGREWSTQDGNLAATLLMTTAKPPQEAAQVSFVAALAAAELAAAYAPPGAVGLKWPNDVMVNGLKVSGILIESGAAPGGGLWLAIGVGVNLARAPEGLERPAAALADFIGRAPPTPAEALERLAGAFGVWLDRWHVEGFGAIRDAWTERAVGLGQACIARLASESVRGVAEGLEADGALRLRLADGSARRITAGDVFFGQAEAA